MTFPSASKGPEDLYFSDAVSKLKTIQLVAWIKKEIAKLAGSQGLTVVEDDIVARAFEESKAESLNVAPGLAIKLPGWYWMLSTMSGNASRLMNESMKRFDNSCIFTKYAAFGLEWPQWDYRSVGTGQ